MDIHKGLGNANVILGRFLYLLADDGQLVNIDGGGLRNAIPREASATVYVAEMDEFKSAFEELKAHIIEEYASLEPNLTISIEEVDETAQALSQEDTAVIACVLKSLHNGVYRLSPDVEDLVEASNNIARVSLLEGKLHILCLTRSSVTSTKWQVAEQLAAVAQLADMTVEFSGDYPGWKPNPKSSILELMQKLYTERFGHEPKVEACHAGLECGIIGANYPQMEMISFGPTIKGAHSPEERVSVASVGKIWDFLVDILKQIPKK